MPTRDGYSAGLAQLSHWLTPQIRPFAALLDEWREERGWHQVGIAWPAESPTVVCASSHSAMTLPTNSPCPASGMLAISHSEYGSRYIAGLFPTNAEPGILWVDANAEPVWTEFDEQYVLLAAKLIERSSAFTVLIGSSNPVSRLDQRLADVAVVAGRMAHDFDNLLTGIIGFTDLSVPLLTPGSQPAKYVAEIGKVGHRGIQFTTQLHQLSRSGQCKPQPSSVSQAVNQEAARLRAAILNPADVRIDIPVMLPAVRIALEPLAAAIGHLLANAIEATPAAGLVEVSAREIVLSPIHALAFHGDIAPGPYVEITVQDTGVGMKAEMLAKLFAEPFVTTKPRHRGLGLAIVYRVLLAHGGGISIDSKPNIGTVAKIVFPLTTTPLIGVSS